MDRWLQSAAMPGPVVEPPGATAPLSLAQEESWYQAAIQRDEPTYQEYDAVLIHGPLDRGAMEYAVRSLAERHDAFRIVYPARRGEPMMRYLEHPMLPLTYLDARDEAAGDPRLFAEAYVRDAVRERFDLPAAPPVRAHLVRLGDQLHLFVMVIFHIIKDGTTEGILMRDLSRFYASHVSGEPPGLPDLPTSLGEFARWQRRLEAAGAFDHNVAYWSEQLAGVAPVDVPGDRPRPAVMSDAGARTYRWIPPSTVAKLRALAHAENGTLFMALMTAFALLIHRYSAESDVPIAFPVRNRPDHLHPLVGCFINTLVFRGRCEATRSFREHLRAARETLLAAYRHQDAPFSRVVQSVGLTRRADQTSLAAALLLLRNPRIERLEIPGCTTERMEIDVRIAKFDLTIECEEMERGLRVGLEYRTSLFDDATAERIVANLAWLLESVTAEPDAPFGELDAVAPEESALIAAWSRGPVRDSTGTLASALLQTAARNPAAVALVDGARTLTYAELVGAARGVAIALLRTGRPRTVAIYADRSAECVVATLGALFAGAAYLPIDPGYPAQRVAFMLEDGQADAVLVARRYAGAHAWSVRALVIEDAPPADDGTPLALPSPADVAYVMYTSGSTGRPNGVVVPHRAVVNYVEEFRKVCALRSNDRVLQLSSWSFDISVEETFGALHAGAALVISPTGVANAASLLLDHCRSAAITVLDLPTAMFNEVVATLDTGLTAFPPSIRLVVVGGEALTRDRAAAFMLHAPNARLVNGYGPTEAAVAVTLGDVTLEMARGPANLPIGRPIANARLSLVAGDHLRAVPAGAVGQIALGGSPLADGYRNRADLNAGRFVRDPASGERLYLTGDLGRYAADGAVQFLGRRDQQAKIRGYRVEPTEIEAHLLAEPGVRDAAVFIDDRQRLAACVVASPGVAANELRARLAEHLPAFAVPERIALAAAIPLTANGKRDREAMERLLVAARSEQARTAPLPDHELTPVEQHLITIWEDALDRRPIGIHDDFFELGGHSLLSARVFTRIEATFGRRLPLQTLFVRPTIASIARAIEAELPDVTSLVTVHEAHRKGRPIFFVHGDFNGGGLYTRRVAAGLPGDRPFYALSPHGSIGDPIPPSIDAMADDYVRLIRDVQPAGPYTVGGFCLGALLAIEIARRLRASGDLVDPVIALQPPTDIYLFAPLTARVGAAARALGRPRTAAPVMHALKLPWRLFERGWRWCSKFADPRRRTLAYAAFGRRWRRYVVERRFEPTPPHWGADIGNALVRIVNAFAPARYDGDVAVIWAFEFGRGPLAGVALRRAALRLHETYTRGSHMTALTIYTDELAEVIGNLLAPEPPSAPAKRSATGTPAVADR